MKEYSRRRSEEETRYSWFVNCGMPAYAELAEIPLDQLFLNVDAIVEAFREGRPLAEELFGPDVTYGPPRWPAISYGHINTLGSQLFFPEDSEPGHTPLYGSLQEGIEALKSEVDFMKAGMFPFYLQMWNRLKKLFPEETIEFRTFGFEGPVGTAWALRGHDFFLDIYERPDLLPEYMRSVTVSIISYKKLVDSLKRESDLANREVFLYDDVAALLSPSCWPEVVIPYHQLFFDRQMACVRKAHIEGMTVNHLPFLDQLQLDWYDPSASPRLTPEVIRDNCRVPFGWRLNTTDYPRLSCEEIEEWVFNAVADGASRVRTVVDRGMCNEQNAQKVYAFVRAAKKVERLLAAGYSRETLRKHRDFG